MANRDDQTREPGNARSGLAPLVFAIVLAVAWCAFIFYMSAQPSDESGAMSGGFSFTLLSAVWPDFSTLSEADQQYWCDLLDYPVRKCAHFSEYTLLGVLFANLLLRIKRFARSDRSVRLKPEGYVIAWACATLYAVTDEIHQIFSPGRACLATDVIIDSAGVLLGVLLFVAFSQMMHYNSCRRLARGD